ncbi:hypothetical protein JWG39_11850 [Desulforhopalus vacuolatus]|uniref:hypothetical protein n=1 Tax=Desulforhopalus vacuolatus TaxID=40414 RepID=UPI001966C1E7|nr:hypothetical protein [Desulforhopalus vacuolatus]MBM9520508.1 hypothetical protein [Desulforhopalus vacuolatus]
MNKILDNTANINIIQAKWKTAEQEKAKNGKTIFLPRRTLRNAKKSKSGRQKKAKDGTAKNFLPTNNSSKHANKGKRYLRKKILFN